MHGFLVFDYFKGEASSSCFRHLITGVSYIGEKFTTSVADSGHKYIAGDIDTGQELTAGASDTQQLIYC